MKKTFACFFAVLILVLALCATAYAEEEDWKEMPVITHFYELSKEKFYVEWEGKADIYQVYVDGKKTATVNLKTAIIELKPGTHQIVIVPIDIESKDVDKRFEINVTVGNVIGESGSIGGGGSIDLGAFGIDPKDIFQGTPSETFKINYAVDPLLNASPEIVGAYTDFDGNVLLSFVDNFHADIYRITIKSGKDVNYVEFDTTSEEAASLITKVNSSVTITLDQDYLRNHRHLIPELDQKYSFSVKLKKWPENHVDGTSEKSTFLESKESKAYDYTPYAAWKNAPVITYASQTADGEITLRWEHEDNGLGCQYRVVSIDKMLGIKKGEKEVAKTAEKEIVIKDLMNGEHTYAVIPVYSGQEGFSSEEVKTEVNNIWVVAPTLECEAGADHQAILKWTAAEGVESYHITVYAGSGSLLRFVNLDYKKYKEFDVQATPGSMEYTFVYDQTIDPENGVKLKFEIYGLRHAANGVEQKSATTTQTVVVK